MVDIDDKIINTLLERPIGFEVGTEHFYIYPMTLGKSQLFGQLLKELHIDEQKASFNLNAELSRVLSEHFDECLRLIAYAVTDGKKCLDNMHIRATADYLKENADAEDILVLLQTALATGNTQDILQHFGIDKELKEYNRVAKEKDDSSTLSYCGKSIWGNTISPLAEKYGWTLNYILWGISLNNINMLLADAPKTIYLTEEERKRLNIHDKTKTFDGNDPASWEKLKQTDWYQRAVKSGDIQIV